MKIKYRDLFRKAKIKNVKDKFLPCLQFEFKKRIEFNININAILSDEKTKSVKIGVLKKTIRRAAIE